MRVGTHSLGLPLGFALAVALFLALTSEPQPKASRTHANATSSITRERSSPEHSTQVSAVGSSWHSLGRLDAPRPLNLLGGSPPLHVYIVPFLSGCTLRRDNARTADRPLVSTSPAQGPPTRS